MINRLRAANLISRHAIPRDVHKEEHIGERFVFAVWNDRDWKKNFSDEVTFSTAKEGPTFVYHSPGTRFDHRYSAIRARSDRVSVSCWGWISHRGMGTIHPICGKFNQYKYQRLLERHMVLYARLLHPEGILQFQQDNHPVHTSKLIRDWFARRQDIVLIDWPRRSPDLNPIENMWAQVKRRMHKNWPNPPPRHPNDLWKLVQDALAEKKRPLKRLVDSMPTWLQNVIELGGRWTKYWSWNIFTFNFFLIF